MENHCRTGDGGMTMKRLSSVFCGLVAALARSEERRVGRESRFRWASGQAGDGIRDGTVTGVQTCALPILPALSASAGYSKIVTTCLISPRGLSHLHIWRFLDGESLPNWGWGDDHETIEQRVLRSRGGAREIGRASCRERE